MWFACFALYVPLLRSHLSIVLIITIVFCCSKLFHNPERAGQRLWSTSAVCRLRSMLERSWSVYYRTSDQSQLVADNIQLIVSSICLLLLTDGLSKCSTILLVVRIITSRATPMRSQRMVCWLAIGVTTIWVATSLGIYASGCTRQCVLDPDATRPDCKEKVCSNVMNLGNVD